jgi:hypothetical protein
MNKNYNISESILINLIKLGFLNGASFGRRTYAFNQPLDDIDDYVIKRDAVMSEFANSIIKSFELIEIKSK